MGNLKPHIVYEDDIDCRHVKCSCGESGCRIGVSFDSEPDVMRLTDKFGNQHCMHLDKKTARLLIRHLKDFA